MDEPTPEDINRSVQAAAVVSMTALQAATYTATNSAFVKSGEQFFEARVLGLIIALHTVYAIHGGTDEDLLDVVKTTLEAVQNNEFHLSKEMKTHPEIVRAFAKARLVPVGQQLQ